MRVSFPPDRPNGGGTLFTRPVAENHWFRRMPNGGQVNAANPTAGEPRDSNPYPDEESA